MAGITDCGRSPGAENVKPSTGDGLALGAKHVRGSRTAVRRSAVGKKTACYVGGEAVLGHAMAVVGEGGAARLVLKDGAFGTWHVLSNVLAAKRYGTAAGPSRSPLSPTKTNPRTTKSAAAGTGPSLGGASARSSGQAGVGGSPKSSLRCGAARSLAEDFGACRSVEQEERAAKTLPSHRSLAARSPLNEIQAPLEQLRIWVTSDGSIKLEEGQDAPTKTDAVSPIVARTLDFEVGADSVYSSQESYRSCSEDESPSRRIMGPAFFMGRDTLAFIQADLHSDDEWATDAQQASDTDWE